MKFYILKLSLSFCALFLFTSGQATIENLNSKKYMLRFEQAYIPVHYYVAKRNMVKAKSAMLYLDHEWNIFYDKFTNRKKRERQESLRQINNWVEDLCGQIDANNYEASAILLGHIKYELGELRRREQVSYYFDNLYQFENSWSTVIQISKDSKMCLYEWSEFEDFVAWAKEAWLSVESQTPPVPELNMTQEQILVMHLKREGLSKKINEYQTILSCGDQGAAHIAAKEIEKAYFEYLRVFGKFFSERTFMAEALKIN